MGFLAQVKGERYVTQDDNSDKLVNDEAYIVKEIIRSFITASWLKSFEERLGDYIAYIKGGSDSSDEKTAKNSAYYC